MTERQSDSSLRELKDLPSPKSPAGLDARIMEQARTAAPEPRSSASLFDWNGPWLRGLATTGVLAVAILIAVPGLRDEQITSRKELSADHDMASFDSEDDALNREMAFERLDKPTARTNSASPEQRNGSLEEVVVTASKSAYPAPAPAPQRQQQRPENQQQERLADSGMAVAESEPSSESRQLKSIAAKAKSATELPRTTVLARLKACESLPSANNSQANDIEHDELQSSGANGQTAQSCYETLKKSCSACALPATLEEARKTLTSEQSDETVN